MQNNCFGSALIRRAAILTLLVTALATSTIQARRPIDFTPKMEDEVIKEDAPLVEPLLQFGSRLMQEIKGDQQNIIFSPVSIHSALNLVLLGAKEGSTTERELLKTLGFGEKPDNKIHESYAKLIKRVKATLNVPTEVEDAESDDHVRYGGPKPPKLDIWTMAIADGTKAKPESAYLESIQKYYNSSLKTVEPKQKAQVDKLVGEINDWAKKAGFESGVIKSGDLEKDFSLLLLSAVMVEAFWFNDFHEYEKKDGLFYNHGLASELKNGTALGISDIRGKYVEFKKGVREDDMLHGLVKAKFGPTYDELADLEFLALEVPLYGDVSFACFMPLKGSGRKLADLEGELLKVVDGQNGTKLGKVLEILSSNEAGHKIEYVRMPKFHFENDISLNGPLNSMGIKLAFDQFHAEITRMSPTPLYVSEAKHQAMIEVNKKGLKAAGVTTIRMVALSAYIRSHPIRVELDHPFLFVVRYNRIPLFMGHLDHL